MHFPFACPGLRLVRQREKIHGKLKNTWKNREKFSGKLRMASALPAIIGKQKGREHTLP